MPNYQGVWSLSTQFQYVADWPSPPITGDLALFLGNDKIDFITITSTGNATDFGDHSTSTAAYVAGMSSSTRGVFAIGLTTGNQVSNIMEYVTMRTKGNTTDFGDAPTSSYKYDSGASNNKRGMFEDNTEYLNRAVEYLNKHLRKVFLND